MNKTLDNAFADIRTLPADRQEQIAQWICDFVDQERSTSQLNDEQKAEIKRRLDDPDPGFATDEQVAALYNKHGA